MTDTMMSVSPGLLLWPGHSGCYSSVPALLSCWCICPFCPQWPHGNHRETEEIICGKCLRAAMDEKGQQGLKQCLSDLIQASKVTTAVLRADPQVGNTLSAILKIAGSISTRLSRNWIKICSILLQSNQIIGSKHTPAMAQALPMPGLSSFIPAVWPFFLAWEVLLCSCHFPSILHCSSCKPSCHSASQEARKSTTLSPPVTVLARLIHSSCRIKRN